MSWLDEYKLWLHVHETGGSWFVERDGRTVALLTDPNYVEMFWAAWRIEPLTDDADERSAVLTDEYWDSALHPRTAFVSREYGTVTENAFWPPQPIREGRIHLRGLYHGIREPWFWNDLVLWLRKKFRRSG